MVRIEVKFLAKCYADIIDTVLLPLLGVHFQGCFLFSTAEVLSIWQLLLGTKRLKDVGHSSDRVAGTQNSDLNR